MCHFKEQREEEVEDVFSYRFSVRRAQHTLNIKYHFTFILGVKRKKLLDEQ